MSKEWSEVRPNPYWEEEAARRRYKAGEISINQRNQIIRAAWYGSGLTDAERGAVARQYATPEYLPGLATLPKERARAILPVLQQYAGTDMAITMRDQLLRDVGNGLP